MAMTCDMPPSSGGEEPEYRERAGKETPQAPGKLCTSLVGLVAGAMLAGARRPPDAMARATAREGDEEEGTMWRNALRRRSLSGA